MSKLLKDGQSCGHPGCLNHRTHPCEGCGRIGGKIIPEFHPIQHERKQKCVSKNVAMMAYKVYCHLYGPQVALITNGCRGGFGTIELIAFLYAKHFPKEQWKDRVDEVFGYSDTNQ